MADYKKFRVLTDKMLEFCQKQDMKFLFPSVDELSCIKAEQSPDMGASFQEAIDVYQTCEKNVSEVRKLVHGAVCFYTSYEDPPKKIRMAIINLLRLAGAYESACIYALEALTETEVQALAFNSMPLTERDGKLNLGHLVLAFWKPEAILAVIMREMKKRRSMKEREKFLNTVIYGIEEPEKLPLPLLKAVSTFLYAHFCRNITEEQSAELDRFVEANEFPKIVTELLGKYCHSDEMECIYTPNDMSEWYCRQDIFERLYADKERTGYFIYNPTMTGAALLHVGLMDMQKFTGAETTASAVALNADFNRHISLVVKYDNSSDPVWMTTVRRLEGDEMQRLLDRMKQLKKIKKDDKKFEEIYKSFRDNCRFVSLFEEAEHYMETSERQEDSINLFNRYVHCKWHDQDIGRNMILQIIKNSGEQLSSKQYMNFLNYYFLINDYVAARDFSARYEKKLGNYYVKAQEQLRRYLEKFSTESPVNKAEWIPLPLRKGYGGFVAYFLEHTWNNLLRAENLSEKSIDELQEEAEKIIQLGSDYVNQRDRAAQCFLEASAILNRARTLSGSTDMDETMIEFTIKAFYNLRYQEASALRNDCDVERSYLEQLLRLRRHLNPQYEDESLKIILEDALKRYFKKLSGHDNDTLEEAVRYMAENRAEEFEFGRCLLRLSIYYPDILAEPEIVHLLQTDRDIRYQLALFVKSIESMNGSTVDIVFTLQRYRDFFAEEYNDCDFAVEITDCLGDVRIELEKTAQKLQNFCANRRLFRILSTGDRKYIDRLMELLKCLPEENTVYAVLLKYKKECLELKSDLERKPCSFALEQLYECICVLGKYVERLYCILYAEVQTHLSVQALFAEEDSQDTDSIRIYLQIKCIEGKSALRDIVAAVEESNFVGKGERQSVCSYVGGANPEYGFIRVHLKKSVCCEEKLCFKVQFDYIVEMLSEKKTITETLNVSLQDMRLEESYEQLYNPGSALDASHDMARYTFYGRDKLINKICQNFYDFPQSIVVLYGQRRVGKTSIANYVTARIQNCNQKFLVVKCGNSGLKVLSNDKKDYTEETIRELYAIVLQKLAFTIEKDHERAAYLQKETLAMKETAYGNGDTFKSSVTTVLFQRRIMELEQAFEREECWRGTRILLWFDEFQQYYLYILKGQLQPEFVGFIKAFTEEYGFSLLLVGCEPMLPFIRDSRFGNTFSAATQEHVEYLTEESAKNLICEPIQKKSDRKNPFVFVTDEIYQLSAGSPYFIQLICKNLVDDLNDQRKVYANKQMIIDSLRGNGQVSHDKFNCLYESLDLREMAASPEDNKKVLIAIALSQGQRVRSSRENIIEKLEGKTAKPVLIVIAELLSRKIVEEVQGELRIVVRLYEAWIWENRFALGDYEVLTKP